MAASGTSTWPSLSGGNKARASEVETKFDWLEANILPMNAGSTTTGVYDLGSTLARWNNVYVTTEVFIAGNPTLTWIGLHALLNS